MVGAALSQGHSTTLGFSTGLFKRFQNPKDKRDFVTAGTSPSALPMCVTILLQLVWTSPGKGRLL